MADEPGESGGNDLPPKLNLQKKMSPGDAQSSEAKKPSAVPGTPPAANTPKPSPVLKPKPPAGAQETGSAAPRPPASAARPASKKETSRIPLDSAKAGPGTDIVRPSEAPRTIRIKPKPAETPSTIKLKPKPPQELSRETDAGRGVAVPGARDKKKETSRVSLDAVLSPQELESSGSQKPSEILKQETDQPAEEKSAPKTIKLKRPGSAAPPKVAKQDQDQPISGLGQTSRMEETSRIESEAEEPTPTRRKTIRVKRSGQESAPKIKTSVGGLSQSGQPQAGPGVQQSQPVIVEDKPHWFFHFVAVLAILVVIATIYVFCSQAIGPNPSLTQLSWYVEGPDLGMPMKLAPPRR